VAIVRTAHGRSTDARPKNRLDAFSDGVIAILTTIMVLELKIPHGDDWATLQPLLPMFVAYVLSFVRLAIYRAAGQRRG